MRHLIKIKSANVDATRDQIFINAYFEVNLQLVLVIFFFIHLFVP